MTTCDLCGAETDPHTFTRLHKWLRVEGVVEICPKCRAECDAWLNAEYAAAQKPVEERFRERLRTIRNTPDALEPLPILPWWRRLLW